MTREQAIQIAHEEWHTPDTDVAVSLVRMFERLGILKLEGRPEFIVTVRGNCGQVHSFDEWKHCRACDTPQSTKHETFNR